MIHRRRGYERLTTIPSLSSRVRRTVHFKKFIHTNVLAGNAFLANTVPSTAWGRPYRAVSWDLITAVRRAEWPCVGTPTGTASLTITRRFFRTVKRVTGTFRSTNFTLDRTTVSCHIISTIVQHSESNFWWWIALIEVEVTRWFVRIPSMFKDCYLFTLVFNIRHFQSLIFPFFFNFTAVSFCKPGSWQQCIYPW